MDKWIKFGVFIVVIGALLSGCLATAQKDPSVGQSNKYDFVGQEVSKFEVKDYNGNSISNDFFKDYDVTMINFWSPNCKPCLEELPEIQALYQQLTAKNLGLMTVCVDGQSNDLKTLLNTYEMAYPIILLEKQKLMKECLNDFEYIPFSIFVDREGRYIDKIIIGSKTEKEYLEAIEAIEKKSLSH